MRDPVARRVASLVLANLVKMPTRGPTLMISGRRYALSDYWPMMDMGESSGEGARLIQVEHNKFRYLWVYDTDRKTLVMWRHSDGDEKVHDRGNSTAHHIHALEKKKQLNRVTHEEFVEVERYMGRQYDAALKSMKDYLAENASDFEKLSEKVLRDWFERTVRPNLERQLKEVAQGVFPLGFKHNPDFFKPKEDQARSYLVSRATNVKLDVLEDVVQKATGIDPQNPPSGHNQSVEYAWDTIRDEVVEEYLR